MLRSPVRLVVLVAVITAAGCSVAPDTAPGEQTRRDTSGGADRAALAGRAAHTMTALPNGDLLVAGGCDTDGCAAATNSAFLLSGTSLDEVDDLAQARDSHTAVALPGGRVLVAGGFAGEGRPPLASAEVFDPVTGTWDTTGSLREGRGGHAAALLGDGRVLVAGGWVGPSTYTSTTEIYDPVTGDFTAGPRLPVAADGLAATPLGDGCVLVVGGQSRSQVATDRAVTVCPDGSLREVGSLQTARFKHGATALDSGEVLVVGGTPDDEALLTSTELYDPRTRRFRPGPELLAGRYKLTDAVATLPDGRVAVAGGGNGVELIDIGAGITTDVDALGRRTRSFSTVGVTDGQLVVVGGYDESIRLTHTYLTLPVTDL
ncbi:Kelch repeat-containing protein [Nocardioides coralli]|uniref:Kelch repeat-containing protein n=1 Tax=Nocardioides coralli TaxID=2872154 RepID=UPI001CA42EEC|nr:kelch repeat-containing protein [Nocardioides coralli]QZY29102.1 hypothetical protein K6T13_17010 [Nocardioides coralli]